jgi:hypothetical protein
MFFNGTVIAWTLAFVFTLSAAGNELHKKQSDFIANIFKENPLIVNGLGTSTDVLTRG